VRAKAYKDGKELYIKKMNERRKNKKANKPVEVHLLGCLLP
jgi:hypothetical protein